MNTRIIVIPAFNEEKTIGAVVESVIDLCNFVIVVDDSSNDNTQLVVSRFSRVILIRNEQNIGYSKSLEIGLSKAIKIGGKYIMTLDADGQHPIELVDRIFNRIESQKLDMVVGVRDELPRISECIIASISRFFWGIGDITCGMKCYRDTLLTAAGLPKKFDSTGTFVAFFALVKGYKFEKIKIKIKQRIGESRYGAGIMTEIKLLLSIIRGYAAAIRNRRLI